MKLSKLWKWLKKELIRLIPALIYFLITFNIIHYASGLMLEKGHQHSYFSYLSVNIFAILVAKVIMIADILPILNAFPKKPLAYNIIWKFIIYMVLILLLWILDTFVHNFYVSDNYMAAIDIIKIDVFSPIFFACYLWLGLVFLGYLTFSEITRALGRDKIMKMFFG